MSGTSQTRVTLLGAGASVESGLPDGEALAARLIQTGRLPLLGKSLNRLRENGFPDIERAFSVLDAVADLERPGSLMADLKANALLHRPLPMSPEQAASELEIIQRELRQLLWHVDGIGSVLKANLLGEPYKPPEKVQYLLPLVTDSIGGTIASLNYDNSLELAGGALVKVAEPGSKRVMTPEEQPNKVRLLKLHGSLDWKRTGDDVIGGAQPREREEYTPGIVFGAANKLRHYGPYLDLLRAFVGALAPAKHLFVIGYGFRDPHINEAIRIWAAKPGEKGLTKVLTVTQGPDSVRLPRVVESWQVYDHLTVRLIPLLTSAFIKQFFSDFRLD